MTVTLGFQIFYCFNASGYYMQPL